MKPDLKRHARRRWIAWGFLLVAIVSGASGTSALSRTAGFTQWGPSAIVVGCYSVCFFALTRALRVIPMSIAYAVWSGIGIVLVSLIGWVLFDQPLTLGQITGIALIMVGAIVLQLVPHPPHDQ